MRYLLIVSLFIAFTSCKNNSSGTSISADSSSSSTQANTTTQTEISKPSFEDAAQYVGKKPSEVELFKKYNLENRLKEIPVKEHGVFCARAEDTEAMKQILKRNGFDNEVRTEDIRIGGFRYEDVQNALEYDCCFEAALNDQLKWFRENSGFTVYRKEESK